MSRSSIIIYIPVLQPAELTRERLPLRQRRNSTRTKQAPVLNKYYFCLLFSNEDFVANCYEWLLTLSYFADEHVLDKTYLRRKTTLAVVNEICTSQISSCHS